MGCPVKNIFRQKYTNDKSREAVFDGDYESAIIFGENIYTKNKIVKYECILACNSSHFNNFTGNKCGFSWALIWYEILCDIIYTLGCRGGRNHFASPCRRPVSLL